VIALQNLRSHKLRSFLMLLGIILSVSTLILVIALVAGMNQYFAERVANLGSNVFLVAKMGIITDNVEYLKAMRRNRDVTWEDYEALRDELKTPMRVGVEVRTNGKVRNERQSLEDIDIRGVTSNIGEMDIEEVATGRYISDSDDQHHAMVALIGAEVAKKLLPSSDPLQKTIAIDGEEFTVIGVAKPVGTAFGQSQDNFVYIPVGTWLKIHGRNKSLHINIQARGPEWMARTREEVRVLMRSRRHLAPNQEDNFGIIASDSLMDLWGNLTGTLASGMVGLVSIFLVIGGVVIMNVMLASVTERTREIGIRLAVGAHGRDVLLQFLTEAIVLSLLGGTLGILFGVGTSVFVGRLNSWPVQISTPAIVGAVLFSAAVGVFFGFYPARKAAQLDPIEALRYE
jgi:putative ABC transport system permease protein